MNIEDAAARAAGLPCWTNPGEPKVLDGGITNRNFRVADDGKNFVVRIGDDIPVHGVMRWNEHTVSEAAHRAGLSPRVHYHEPGVLVLEFIEGRPYAEADVADPENLPKVVDLVRSCHRDLARHVRGPVLSFWIHHIIRDYVATLRDAGSSHVPKLTGLETTAGDLEVATGPVQIVLGHNDMLAANIIDDGTRLWLIDWEYAGFSASLFDLAGLATNNGLSEEQERFMLERYHEDTVGEGLWRSYTAMKCASLMRETLWSMVSETHSAIDFDYAEYTAQNLARLDAALVNFRNT